ncbi:phosphotransferase enzyme family protein [Aestuariivirga sp.]|uniref:phosphotransferase enzyme family protein n=1 Tax=Aestuariivirga sp. TaxID=2650926 RepID=UPI003594588D
MTDFDSLPHDQQLPILLELATAATANFDLPPGVGVTMVNLSENATYKVEAPDGRRWALRIHRDGYHSRTAIASELAWLIDLRQTGVVATPAPVKGKDGEIIQQVLHPRMVRPRNIVLFGWETGAEPGIGEDLSEPFEVLGEITARMHVHARQWKRPPWFTRLTWDFDTALGDDKPHWGRWRDGVGMDREKEQLFQRTVDLIDRRLAAYGKGPERFGLIHCDLRLANLLIDGKSVKVIDFDDCGFGWYLYDAATPVSFYEHEPQVPGLIESWTAGYRKVLALPKEDEVEIPTFIMLRRILLVAWISSHIEAEFPKSLGAGYTDGSLPLCEDYLRKFG